MVSRSEFASRVIEAFEFSVKFSPDVISALPLCDDLVTCTPRAAAPRVKALLSLYTFVLLVAVIVRLSPATSLPPDSALLLTVTSSPSVTVELAVAATMLSEPVTPTKAPPDAPITSESAIRWPSSPAFDVTVTPSPTSVVSSPIMVSAERDAVTFDEIIPNATPPETATPTASPLLRAFSKDCTFNVSPA